MEEFVVFFILLVVYAIEISFLKIFVDDKKRSALIYAGLCCIVGGGVCAGFNTEALWQAFLWGLGGFLLLTFYLLIFFKVISPVMQPKLEASRGRWTKFGLEFLYEFLQKVPAFVVLLALSRM